MSKLPQVEQYPEVRRSDKVDTYGTESVPDPYHWYVFMHRWPDHTSLAPDWYHRLEDVDSDETAQFVAAQNAVTEPILASTPGHRL